MSRDHKHRSQALLLVLLTAALFWTPTIARANAVDDWTLIGRQVIVTTGARAGLSQIDFAYVHIVIYDAVNAIDGRYTVFAVVPSMSAVGASPEAATAAAARTMLKWLFPAQAASIETTYTNYLLGIPNSPAKTQGINVGIDVANQFIVMRTGDGRNAAVTYTFSLPGPGVYQPTPAPPPGYTGPVGPWVPGFKTFGIKDATQFRAPGPANLTSAKWAQDYNETKAYGAATGSLRTATQTGIGLFYAENPGLQGNRNIYDTAAPHNFSVADSARFYAQLYVTMADAQITTWNSKYYYNFWRPVTAIRAGDIDGNAKTEPNLSWSPLVVTPQHMEYPAAHPTVTGAFAYGLKEFFGTKSVDVTMKSTFPGATPSQHFTDINDIVKNVINGRIYGGMHYRTSGEHGAAIAKSVAHYIARNYFRKVADVADDPDDVDEQ